MKKQLLLALAACSISVGFVQPSFAGVMADVAGLFGSTTAVIVDAPEGVLVDSLWRCPKKTSESLAETFGDSNGLGQRAAGAIIGIPYGVVVGIPVGAIQGVRHGWTSGWEKPFSTESFLVPEEEGK